MSTIHAVHVGEEGFVAFLRELEHLRVLSREDRLRWLELHGAVIRWTEPPLDEDELEALARGLGWELE